VEIIVPRIIVPSPLAGLPSITHTPCRVLNWRQIPIALIWLRLGDLSVIAWLRQPEHQINVSQGNLDRSTALAYP
jgi:hypothetical protein